jgi:acyl carrier protein
MTPTPLPQRDAAYFFEALDQHIRETINPDFNAHEDRLIDFLDSVSLLQLIVHIEEAFQIYLDAASLSLEVFVDLTSLSNALQEHAASDA